jgi:hypothetical protein
MEQGIYNMYSTPQEGGLLPVFSGSRRNLTGGGLFSTIARFALPILKTLGRSFLSAGTRGASRYLSGEEKFIPAMMTEFKDEAVNLAERGVTNIKKRRRRRQTGSGKKKVINKKRRIF